MKQNCWEYKKCGRQPGGEKAGELGVCPVATATSAHQINEGINGGRACWAIEGSLCDGTVQGKFSTKLGNCLKCDFYSTVRSEEARNFASSKEILAILEQNKAKV